MTVVALEFSTDGFEMPNQTMYCKSVCAVLFYCSPKKIKGLTNQSLKTAGFGRTHRTHANATTVL